MAGQVNPVSSKDYFEKKLDRIPDKDHWNAALAARFQKQEETLPKVSALAQKYFGHTVQNVQELKALYQHCKSIFTNFGGGMEKTYQQFIDMVKENTKEYLNSKNGKPEAFQMKVLQGGLIAEIDFAVDLAFSALEIESLKQDFEESTKPWKTFVETFIAVRKAQEENKAAAQDPKPAPKNLKAK